MYLYLLSHEAMEDNLNWEALVDTNWPLSNTYSVTTWCSLNDCSILYYNQQCTRYYFGSSPQLSFVRPGRLVLGSIPSLQDIPTISCENEDQDLLICSISVLSWRISEMVQVSSCLDQKCSSYYILIGFNMLEFIQKFQPHLPMQK